MNNGRWIKLYAKIWENPHICKDADHIAIWIYLLTNATHQEYKSILGSEEITLKSGQLITGRKAIAKILKINESKVQRVLNYFQKYKIIEQRTTSANRLISILKWSMYQQSEQQVNNKRTTSEHIQEHKNNRNNYYTNNYTNDLFNDFLEMRKKLKAINSEKAIKLLLNKLEPFSDDIKNKMIENAIANSWKSVYELKGTQKTTEPSWFNEKQEKELLNENEKIELEGMLSKYD